MSYLSLLINTCDVYRPSVAESYGTQEKTYDTSTPDVEDLMCRIEFFSSQSSRSGGSLSQTIYGQDTVEGWLGFFLFGADIELDDLIIDDKAREFIVTTAPKDVTGMEHHVEAQLGLREE